MIAAPQEKIPPPSPNVSYFFVYCCCILHGAVRANFLFLNHFNMLELLPLDEQQELAHCEAVIERGLETFFEVGQGQANGIDVLTVRMPITAQE